VIKSCRYRSRDEREEGRVEDALHATRAAVEEASYLARRSTAACQGCSSRPEGDNHDQDAGITIVLRAMEARCARSLPTQARAIRSREQSAGRQRQLWYNAGTGEYGDMLAMGVVDPTKVTRTALQNALPSLA